MNREEEIINILKNYIFQNEFDEEMQGIFIDQLNRFLDLKKIPKEDLTFKLDEFGKVLLNKGMLIHGTIYDEKILKGIHENGIITGQSRNIYEDDETYNCADFWRVAKDISLREYNDTFPSNNYRTPFGHASSSVAFVLEIPFSMDELVSYDCYRDTENGRKTLKFVNEKGLPNYNHEILSSVIYGVPQNCIQGIILGDRLLQESDCIKFIISEFSDLYLLTVDGVVLSDPHKPLDYDNLLEKIQNYILINNANIAINDLIEAIDSDILLINRLLEYIYSKGINININDYSLDDFFLERESGLKFTDLKEKLDYYTDKRNFSKKIVTDLTKQVIENSSDNEIESITKFFASQMDFESRLALFENEKSIYSIVNLLDFGIEGKKK
ncbi:MAG: hypothetical protein J6B89_00745 [Bacilli bacterium]|nr:hypothetical protein [Bacilli bacterium]